MNLRPPLNEDDISQQLNAFLQAKAKSNNLLFGFSSRKGVNFLIWVQPFVITANPIFVIEAKRLRLAQRDYVQGRTGGIELFKREQEGFSFDLKHCAMMVYVQQQTFSYWFEQINNWIAQLIADNEKYNDIVWEEADKLVELSSATKYVSNFVSKHSRKTLPRLTIRHFWLDMRGDKF